MAGCSDPSGAGSGRPVRPSSTAHCCLVRIADRNFEEKDFHRMLFSAPENVTAFRALLCVVRLIT